MAAGAMDGFRIVMDNLPTMTGSRFYYAPSPMSEAPLAVHALGIAEQMNAGSVVHPPHTAYGLLIHFDDPVEIATPAGRVSAPAGATAVWPPYCPRHYGRPDQAWRHSWVNLLGADAHRLLTDGGLPLGQPLMLNAADLFDRYLAALCDELHSHVPPDPFVVEGLVRLLVHELTRRARHHQAGRLPERLASIHPHINANLHRPMSLDELARHCHLSVSRFSALFVEYFHASPMAYVRQLKMTRAAMLLAQGNQSVSQIATALGYDDPLHFSRRFKQHHGLSPTAYRQRRL